MPGPIVPLIALPTTAGTGSEATPVSVITDPATEMKIGVASPHLIPRHAICDPLLTVGAPPVVTAHAGIDALSHAIEAYMAAREEPSPELVLGRPQVGKNLLSDTLALTAAGHIVRNLERAVTDGSDLEARTGMLYGSLLAGIAFANSGVVGRARAAVRRRRAHAHLARARHRAAAPLRDGVQPAGARAPSWPSSRALMGGDAVTCMHELGLQIGLPASLARIGVTEADLRPMAEASLGIKRLIDNNPRPLDVDALEAILTAAWHGEPSRLAPVAA